MPAQLSFFAPNASASQLDVVLALQRLEEARAALPRQQEKQQAQKEQVEAGHVETKAEVAQAQPLQEQQPASATRSTTFPSTVTTAAAAAVRTPPQAGMPERSSTRGSTASLGSQDASMEGDGVPRRSSLRTRMKHFKKKLTPRKVHSRGF